MLENKRKTRLYALSSIVCLQAGPPWQTLRARRICPLRALDRLENRTVSGTCLPAHQANPLRRMALINRS
jgi:hypothetical protein